MVSDVTNAGGEELTTEDETTEQLQEGTTEPTAEQPESQTAAPTVEELQRQIEEERASHAAQSAKLTQLEANYKAMQRNLEASRRAGQSADEIRRLIEELQENQAATLDYIEELKSGGEVYVEDTGVRPSAPKKTRLETLRDERAAKANVSQRAENARIQMLRMLSLSGIDPETAAKNTDAARVAFEAGKYEESVDLFGQGLVQAQKQKATATPPKSAQDIEKEVEERANSLALQMMKERGLLDVDMGGAAGSSGNDDAFMKRYSSFDYTPTPADHKRAAEIQQKTLKGG